MATAMPHVNSDQYMDIIDRLFDWMETKTGHSEMTQRTTEEELAEENCLREFFLEILEMIRRAEEQIGSYAMTGVCPAATRGVDPGPFHTMSGMAPARTRGVAPPPLDTQPHEDKKHWFSNPFHHAPAQPPPPEPTPVKEGWMDTMNPFHHHAPAQPPPPKPTPVKEGWMDTMNPFHHHAPAQPPPKHEEMSWFAAEGERLKRELMKLWPFEDSKSPPPPGALEKLKHDVKDRIDRMKYIGADSWLQKKYKRISCCSKLVLQ